MPKAKRVIARKTSTSKTKTNSKVNAKEEILDIHYCAEGEAIEPSDDLLDYCILIYGESGIGKTSTCSKIPDSYIIQCDPNRKNLGVRQTNIDNISLTTLKRQRPSHTPWNVIETVIARICEDDSVQRTIIDNFGLLYEHAFRHKCYMLGITDPTAENDFGQTWRDIEDTMTEALNRLLYSGKGVVLIAHDHTKEIDAGNDTYDRIEPSMQKAPFKWVKACTDFGFYLSYGDSGQRVWNLRGDREIWLKCCTDADNPHFYSPDGEPVRQISAGSSPGEAWGNLMKSWNNELHDVSETKGGRKPRKFKREKASA